VSGCHVEITAVDISSTLLPAYVGAQDEIIFVAEDDKYTDL
jgi:hypothetical protein